MAIRIDSSAAAFLEADEGPARLRTRAILLEISAEGGDHAGHVRHEGEMLRRQDVLFEGDIVLVIDAFDHPFELAARGGIFYAEALFGTSRAEELIEPVLRLMEAEGRTDPVAARATSDLGATQPQSGAAGQAEHLLALFEREGNQLADAAELLVEVHELLGRGLDHMDEEAQMVTDAVNIAIDQVQDMRIKWTETPPETALSNVLMTAVLIVAFEAGAAAAVGFLLLRAFRCFRKVGIKRGMQQQLRAAEHKQFQSLSLREQANLDKKFAARRIHEANLERARAQNAETLQPLKAELQGQTLRRQRAAAREQELNQALKLLEDEIKELKVAARAFDARSRVAREKLDELIASPLTEERFPQAAKYTAGVLKEAAKALSGKSLRASGADSKDESAGDSPSTLFRMEAIRQSHVLRREIDGLRRELDGTLNLALAQPDAMSTAIVSFANLLNEIVWPPEKPEDYERALRELALDTEFSLWALILPAYSFRMKELWDYAGTGDTAEFDTPHSLMEYLQEKVNPFPQAFDISGVADTTFVVEGLKGEMVRYFSQRFAKKLGVSAGADTGASGDFLKVFLSELSKRREAIEAASAGMLKAAGASSREVLKIKLDGGLYEAFIFGGRNKTSSPNPDI